MESSFQFTNPALTELEFGLNEGFNSREKQEVQIKMNMSIQVVKNETEKEAIVGLNIMLGEKNDADPFFIKATEKAKFRWNDDIEGVMLDKLLNQNAPSLLLSYLRPIIAQITSASPYDAYNIPFINFKEK